MNLFEAHFSVMKTQLIPPPFHSFLFYYYIDLSVSWKFKSYIFISCVIHLFSCLRHLINLYSITTFQHCSHSFHFGVIFSLAQGYCFQSLLAKPHIIPLNFVFFVVTSLYKAFVQVMYLKWSKHFISST